MSKVYPELEIVRYDPHDCDLSLYKNDIMDMEAQCFHENIQSDWEDVRSLMEDSISCFLVVDDSVDYTDHNRWSGKIVGSAYAIPMEKEEDIDKDDPHREHWIGIVRKYQEKKVSYLYSISVLPSHSGKDLAKRLMIELLADCKAKGYDVLLSHAKEGASLHLHDFFGGIHINSVGNWYETGHSHTLCEIDLKSLYLMPMAPFQQKTSFDCGLTCVAMLCNDKPININRDIMIKASGVNHQGTTHEGMIALVKYLGLNPILSGSISHIVDMLKNNHPVIVHTLSPNVYEGHYLLLHGIGDDCLYSYDVYDGIFGKLSMEEFERVWWSNKYQNKWSITI